MGKKGKGFNELENICEDREAARASAATGCMELERYDVHKICVEGFDHPDCAAEGAKLATFKYQEYKSKPKPTSEVTFYSGGACDAEAAERLWREGCVGANGQNVARKFQDRPPNKLTPTLFAQCVEQLLSEHKNCKVEVHEREWIEKKKMGAFLSVSAGSEEEPRFVEVTYANGEKGGKPIVFVGKGVTFDSGGISIKPSANMDLMRGDMGGAATVIGAMDALAALGAKVNMKCLIPMTENMPSGKATRPGDVVTAMNGKTICVDNTDAEGRLILADALSYGACFEPKFILDVATLTGAIGVALGKAAAGGYSNCDALYRTLEEAGAKTGDRVWRMPLWKYYNKVVTDFDAYDINNAASKGGGGSCTAAAFLSEFVPKGTDWIHLDIAGTTFSLPQPQKYIQTTMSGRLTRTLVEFVMMNQEKK